MDKFNEHILLVMRWLQNNDLVSEEELKANSTAAYAAYVTHNAPYAAPYAAAEASAAVAYAAADVASYAAERWLLRTKECLDRYFNRTKQNKKAYEEQAKYLNVLGAKYE